MQHERHPEAKTRNSRTRRSESVAAERPQSYLPEDPAELIDRLKSELRRLTSGSASRDDEEAIRSIKILLAQAHTIAWRGVAQGDLSLPDRIHHLLEKLQRFVDLNASELPAKSRAAVEIRSAITVFSVAQASLAEVRTRARLADRERSETEREVLRVLAESPESYLRRGQVRERLTHKPSPARVGQVLAQLSSEGLLKRIQASAQGNPETAYYGLSPLGHDLVKSLNLAVTEVFDPAAESAFQFSRIEHSHYLKIVIATAIEPLVSSGVRSMAQGILVNISTPAPEKFQSEIVRWIRLLLLNGPETMRLASDVRLSMQRIKSNSPHALPGSLEVLLQCFDVALSQQEKREASAGQDLMSGHSAKRSRIDRGRT